MELELEVNGQKIRALSVDHLEKFRKADKENCPRLVDLRKVTEIEEDLTAEFKEAEKPYLRIPVRADTLSEQDMDAMRREFGRRLGPYAVISTGGLRAAAMLLMHAGRNQEWSYEDALKKCQELKKSKGHEALKERMKGYLERHAVKGPVS